MDHPVGLIYANFSGSCGASCAVDGVFQDLFYGYHTNGGSTGHWLQLDLGTSMKVSKVAIHFRVEWPEGYFRHQHVQVHNERKSKKQRNKDQRNKENQRKSKIQRAKKQKIKEQRAKK